MKTKPTTPRRKKSLKLVANDPWLEPYKDAIEGRHNDAVAKEADITRECGSLDAFANAHNYFGLHRDRRG